MDLINLRWFNDWIHIIDKYFSIIITFSSINSESNTELREIERIVEIERILEIGNYTLIKVKNKGADIGPKMLCVNYLKSKEIEYDKILFLHSKSNEIKRNEYLSKLLVDEDNIRRMSEYQDDKNIRIDGIFPNILQYGTYPISKMSDISGVPLNRKNWGKNEYHVTRLQDYFNIKSECRDYLFTEGNFYLLSRRISELIFGDLRLYLELNDLTTFDYNWFIHYYGCKYLSYNRAIRSFCRSNLFGNNFASKLGYKGLPDAMIEHAYERIVINVINNIGGNYEILI